MKSVWTVAVLGVFAAGILGACEGMPNDVVERQQRQRLEQAAPGPTELPPGLSADLPAPPSEPLTQDKPLAQEKVTIEN